MSSCNLRRLFDKMKSLKKSSAEEKIEDRIYKQKDGRVQSIRRKLGQAKQSTKDLGLESERANINKPMHTSSIPMLPRVGNKQESK